MKSRFRLYSHNGFFFKKATIGLSTVELPRIDGLDIGYNFESCLFLPHDNEVLMTYQTKLEAIEGHTYLKQKLGL